MKMNVTDIASSMLIAAAVAVCGVTEANGQSVIGSDDFDGGGIFVSRTLTPDLIGGMFATASDDIFGIVGIDASNAISDIAPSTKEDLFLGFNDTDNSDNEDGEVSVEWTFDIAGSSNLGLSFEMAALGDFEGPDTLSISASIDGGTQEVIASAVTNNDISFTYTLENGTQVTLDDPLELTGPGLNPTVVFNSFEAFSFPLSGTGSQLVITLTATTNGQDEAFGVDNLQITGVTGPGQTGDLNGDGVVDCVDVDEYAGNIGATLTATLADLNLNTDDVINVEDVQILIADLIVASNGITGTIVGDLNCDGQINVLGDALVLVSNLGNNNAVYTEGDLNLNGTVNVLGDALILVINLGTNNQ